MTTFRLRRPNLSLFAIPISIFKRPLLLLSFAYFLTSSADVVNVHLLLFKVKLTNAIALLLFAGLFLSRMFQVWRESFFLFLAILICMFVSIVNSPNVISSAGAVFLFIFSYVFYFLVPYNQIRFFNPEWVLRAYFFSFYCVGFYALAQVVFSVGGIHLPGVDQFIHKMARGAAFAYEPSFYALYMTPFTVYCTSKFLLQERSERKVAEVFWPNVFLLASTSTGCFFSYLFFLFSLLVFQYFRIIRLAIYQLMAKFFVTFLAAGAVLLVLAKEIVQAGLLKFFFYGGAAHFSVMDRWNGIAQYWHIFLEHPLIGISFGAGPFYLAKKNGLNAVSLLDPDMAKTFSAMNVTTEVLASVGILGGLCFLYFFYMLVRIFRSTLKIEALTKEERIALIAFGLSLCVMFMTLQFNQSIMRAYMWIHVAIFCGYARYLKEKYAG